MNEDACGRFDAALAALVSGVPDGEERGGERAALRAHASRCARCADALPLLDWADGPATDRDGWELPGPSYWEGFQHALAARIRRDRSERVRRAARGGLVAAAVLAGLALLVGRLSVRPEGALAAAGIAADEEEAAVLAADDRDGWDDLAAAEAEETGAPFRRGSNGDLFPDVEGLDEGERLRLLDWLSSEERRLLGGAA